MVEHRRWKSLSPIVPLQEGSKYDELMVRIFQGNPSISGEILHDFYYPPTDIMYRLLSWISGWTMLGLNVHYTCLTIYC